MCALPEKNLLKGESREKRTAGTGVPSPRDDRVRGESHETGICSRSGYDEGKEDHEGDAGRDRRCLRQRLPQIPENRDSFNILFPSTRTIVSRGNILIALMDIVVYSEAEIHSSSVSGPVS